MKVISTGFPEGYDPNGPKKKKHTKFRPVYLAGIIPAILVAAGIMAVPVLAGNKDTAGVPDAGPPALSEPAAPGTAAASDTDAAGETLYSFEGATVSASQQGIDTDAYDWDAGGDPDAVQLSVTEEAVPDGIVDEVALAAAAREAAVTSDATDDAAETATEPAAAKAEPVKQEPVTEPEPESEAVTEPVQDGEPVATDVPADTEPPAWLITEPDPDLPENEQTMPVQEVEPAPEWLLALIDRAMWNVPYDGGPLCQKSWAQVPVPLDNCDTRGYVELDTPVSWLSQGDLLGFVGSVIRYCDADWFTITGSDGWGIQFPGCNTDFAVYGPLDEYGEVTVVVRYLFLGENGFYAVEP